MTKILLSACILTIALNAYTFKELKIGCDTGTMKSCSSVGLMYQKGEEVEQDYVKAVKYYTMACDKRDMFGCYSLGMMYGLGDGVTQDMYKSMKYLLHACKGGNGNACFYAGVNYYKGNGVQQNTNEAKEFFGKACDYEDTRGCKNYAMLKTGLMLTTGLGITEIKKYEKACHDGNMTACNKLGEGYKKTKDYDKAFKYLHMACKDEDVSCNSLADLYEEGYGVPQDKEKAFNLRLDSCGYLPNNCADIGIRYERGDGVDKDPFKAVKFYHSGCIIMKEDKACYRLGIMYSDGRGVRLCVREAKQFQGMACDYGNNNGCKAYSAMNKGGE